LVAVSISTDNPLLYLFAGIEQVLDFITLHTFAENHHLLILPTEKGDITVRKDIAEIPATYTSAAPFQVL
jgi:hypothetical protein